MVLDGEIVVLDDNGKPSFQALLFSIILLPGGFIASA